MYNCPVRHTLCIVTELSMVNIGTNEFKYYSRYVKKSGSPENMQEKENIEVGGSEHFQNYRPKKISMCDSSDSSAAFSFIASQSLHWKSKNLFH